MKAAFSIALLLVLVPLRAWQPARVDVTQQAAPAESDIIDHLEPADVAVPHGYYLIRYTAGGGLEGQNDVLTITRRENDNKYFLEKKTIWAGRGSEAGVRLPPLINLEIPESLALLAYEMWVNALYEVRYDRNCQEEIMDASTEVYSVYIRNKGWLAGTTQLPTHELPPKWMESAAQALLTAAQDGNVAVCQQKLVGLHEKLIAYLRAHGISTTEHTEAK